MSLLINVHNLTHSFSSRTLFRNISFSISAGDRIGLIGPNGAGKSTLLKILAGQMKADEGQISVQRGLKVGLMAQVPEFSAGATIRSTLLELSADPDDWQEMARSETLSSKLNLGQFDGDFPIDQLSGGWRKRVALGRELMREPDLLLLDEPTNHLDVDSILWLEEYLANAKMATLTITHDRLFLQRVANQIMDLDRRYKDGLLRINGDYASYLEAREIEMNAQEQQETKLRNTLRRETEWLRRGAQARQTKQKARIEKHGEISEQVNELGSRNQDLRVRMNFHGLEKNPKKLIEAKGISKSYDGELIVPVFDFVVSPKTRVGLLGANGSGKSTLIRLLTGVEESDTGEVFRSDSVQIAYFEQNRESLNGELSVLETVCPLGDYIDVGGTKVHVKSYLTRFLFTYEQMDMPVKKLSGGEQSRLLLARLMLNQANVLILDEPTNDLDMATLDVLQEVISEFDGAVLLVTHDRYFLDQTTNEILALDRDAQQTKVIERFADLSQWENWRREVELASHRSSKQKPSPETGTAEKHRRLSFKEQHEFQGMEGQIQRLEADLAEWTTVSQQADVVANSTRLTEATVKMAELEREIQKLYDRWAELERLGATRS